MVWVCPDCSAGYALRLGTCRTCGSDGPMERMARVPKSTHAGVSNAAAGPGEIGYIEPDGTDDDGGGEDVSPGSSSPTSSETPEHSTTSRQGSGPRRARTTGSRSNPARAESGIARSTGGSSRGIGSGPDD